MHTSHTENLEIPSWWRSATPRHFGSIYSLEEARAIVEYAAAVANYGFWPLIRFEKYSRRFDRATGTVTYKTRKVQYAAHLDANIFAYYAELLSSRYEQRLEAHGLGGHVTAYRPLKLNNVHFAAESFAWVRDHAPCRIYCFDVSSFFDNIDHSLLKAAWCDLLGEQRLPADHFAVFSAITQYAFVHRDELPEALIHNVGGTKRYCTAPEFRRLRKSGKIQVQRNTDGVGIPQGIPLCSVLSNLYLLDFDRVMMEEIVRGGGFYRRYCDDIFIALPERAGEALSVSIFLHETLAKFGLPVNTDKTTRHQAAPNPASGVLQVIPPVTYLGLTYDGCQVLLRGATLARFHRRMTYAVRMAHRRSMAAGGSRQLPTGKLRKRFTHIGQRNFFSYVRPIQDVLRQHGFVNPNAIQRQMRRSSARLEHLLKKK